MFDEKTMNKWTKTRNLLMINLREEIFTNPKKQCGGSYRTQKSQNKSRDKKNQYYNQRKQYWIR